MLKRLDREKDDMTTPERESILQELQQNTYLPVLSDVVSCVAYDASR